MDLLSQIVLACLLSTLLSKSHIPRIEVSFFAVAIVGCQIKEDQVTVVKIHTWNQMESFLAFDFGSRTTLSLFSTTILFCEYPNTSAAFFSFVLVYLISLLTLPSLFSALVTSGLDLT